MESFLRGGAVQSSHAKSDLSWAGWVCSVASVALIVAALWTWGAVEVRGHVGEVFFLTLLGVIWLVVARYLFTWCGLSFADDVVERHNVAAAIALSSATLAIATIFAAGNLGEGPSYWNNIFSAAVGSMGFFVLWLIFEFLGRVSISVTEERDPASGIRFAGLLLALGIILGRAVAGDWHSKAATVQDLFRDGWPAAILTLIALGIEKYVRPSRRRPCPAWTTFGLLPALTYLSCAVAWGWHLGRWEGMPR
jgi:uncharacterized membrane protein YjfL (UPF0719 family)